MQPHERRIQWGYWLAIGFTLALGVAAVFSVASIVRGLGEVAFTDAADMIAVQDARVALETKSRKARSYLISGNEQTLARMRGAETTFAEELARLKKRLHRPEERALIEVVERTDREHQAALERVIAMRRAGRSFDSLIPTYELEVQPTRDELDQSIAALTLLQERELASATLIAKQTLFDNLVLLCAVAVLGLGVSVGLGIALRRAFRSLEQERERAAHHAARVEDVNRELDAFATRVSHDLRNLLSPISVAAAILRGSHGDPARVEAMSDRIQRGIDRSVTILDGLLLFSRSGAPHRDASCSVTTVVEDVLDELAPIAARIDATIERKLDDHCIACSRELFSVVVLNVLGNALKFLEGQPRRALTITARSSGRFVELTVSDTGPGIPDGEQSRIFEPFYRVPGTSAGGSGIGLATVRRIIEAHGGRITVESKRQAGATFVISLPRAPSGPTESVGAADSMSQPAQVTGATSGVAG
jgi:signal transduction histidine kinase